MDSKTTVEKFETLPLKFSRLFQNARDRNDGSSMKPKEQSIRFHCQCKRRVQYARLIKPAHVDAATRSIGAWLRTKSLFAGIFIYGRRAFRNAAVETPVEFSNNFAAATEMQRRPFEPTRHQRALTLRGEKRDRTREGGGLVSWQTAWWAGTSMKRGVVNGKPLFSNQIICSTLGGETRGREENAGSK